MPKNERPAFKIIGIERTDLASHPLLNTTTENADALRFHSLTATVDDAYPVDVQVSVVPRWKPDGYDPDTYQWGYINGTRMTTHIIHCGTTRAAKAVASHIRPLGTVATSSITLLDRIESVLPHPVGNEGQSSNPDLIDAETYLVRCEHLMEILLQRLTAKGLHQDAALAATALFLVQDVLSEIENL